ncbi:unnamed protein product [Taenia asiatica]|uniref:SAC3_GANP domain-containing protein n=1 Tax=Taenia asiatica TaxID=60517 RepID=A0A0R3VUJ2_TAEAS|nr:unnamed protein product [Taenia asiatica]
MSHPWSYYASSGYYQYPYYGAFGYNTQACGDNQSQQASDVSDATTQIPQPPGAQSDSTVSTAASTVSTVAPQYTYGVYGAYFPYNMAAYSSDLAMYAAQRWNAVNCSYYSHCSGTSAVGPTSNALNSPRTDSRFSGQNGAVNSAGSGTITGNNNASSDSNASKLFESGGGESKWSPELKAFLSTETPIEKDQMERILRQKIEYVFRNSVSVDWTKEPIPTIPTKCLAAVTQSTAKKSSVNVVRPVPLQPWRTRGRNAGALPTGTLVRNQQTSVLSGEADVEKSNVVPSPLSSNNRATEPLPLPELAESTKRKRCFHQRSGSSRSSSTSSSYRDESRQKRISRKRSPRSPVRPSNKRRKYHRESGTDSDHLTNDRTNSEGSDNSPVSVSPKLRRGRNKKRVGSGRKKPSPKRTSPSPSAAHGGKRGGANVSRGRGGKTAAQQKRWVAPDTSHHRLSQRADRFKDHLGAGSIAKSTRQLSLLASVTDSDLLSEKLEQFNIVGTMQELEKPYLRLTAAPDPANVRPPDVLKKAVAHVKQRWKERGDYLWVCEQFKSIRQDLTVQRIQTELTAEVYEAHADIALEAGDLQEFHQCQSQLSLLHAEGLGSSRRTEFTAYRLLYYIFTQDLLAMSTLLASLKDSQKANPFIQFALKVREAWALRNYKRFFHLACDSDAVAPFETKTSKMRGCRQILSWSLDRERKFALKAIFKTYRPYLSFDFVTKTLGFDDASSCAGFIIQELGVAAATLESVEKVDCKAIWSQMRQSGAVDAVDH